MAKHLIVCGHGQNDPGAVGNGTNERDFTRNVLKPLMEKWGSKLKNNSITFYNAGLNMFAETNAGGGAYGINGFDSVTEIHLDAASALATGGHVIISSGFNPDSADLGLANVIRKYVGWWGGVANTQGVNKRNNLLNLNVFAQRGISYRLIEIGFITNGTDMTRIKNNVDNIAKEFVEAITGESLGTASNPVTVADPVKANVDLVNLNSQAFKITGWLLNTKKDLRQTTPWVLFIDANTGYEVARQQGKWVNRPDVLKAFPSPSQASVGVEFDGSTPKVLNDGGKFKLMFRASDSTGNKSESDFWFDNLIDDVPNIDTGYLDETQPVNGKVKLLGWHLASGQRNDDHHFLIMMDSKSGFEIARWDITEHSYLKSEDVKKVFPDNRLLQSAKCRFEVNIDIPEKVKGKKVFIKSRYCSDKNGNTGVTGEIDFTDRIIIL